MHNRIVNYRKRFGDNWLTVFPDGTEIPWRQLSLQEFLDIDDLFRSGKYTPVEIEDEVFCKAVLNTVYVENIDILSAGVVSVVSEQILQVSGPGSADQIQQDLNRARFQVQDFISSVIPFICSVFPAYKPEDLLTMKYDTFMKRLASAESRLLSLGIIKEPFSVLGPGEEQPQQLRQEKPSERKRRELLEEREQRIAKKMGDLNKPSGTIISREQMSARDPNDTGHDLQDKALWQHDARQGLEFIYPELFKAMKQGKKVTPDLIQETKGKTAEEVKDKHSEYFDKLKSGEIQPVVPKFLVADKLEAQSVNKSLTKKPDKVKVKRK